MTKKMFLIITVLIGLLTVSVMANSIVIKDNDTRVVLLKENGILIGDENGNLNLNQTLKRQEMVVLISRLMGKEEEAKNWDTSSLTFQDVDKNDWAAGYIAWARDNSITKGYSDEWFGYNDSLTSVQTQIFLLRVLGNLEAEMYNANKLATEIGLMRDIVNQNQEQIIRSDVAIMLYNTLEIGNKVTNENVFLTASNNIINFVDKVYTEYKNTSKVTNEGEGKIKLKIDAQMTDKYKEAEKLNGMEAIITSQVDLKKEILKMALNLNQNNNEIVDGEIIIDSENLYVKIKDIIDKYIYESLGYNMFTEYSSEVNTDSIVIIKNIYDNVKLDIIDILSKESISKEEAKTLINGTEVLVTKNSIKMNTKLTDKFMLVIYKELKNNKEFIDYMVETTNASYDSWGEWGQQFKITKEDVKEELQTEIELIEERMKRNVYYDDGEIYLNIYTSGLLKKPVKYEIESVDSNDKVSFVCLENSIELYYTSIYYDEKNEFYINLNKAEENTAKLEIWYNRLDDENTNNKIEISADVKMINDSLIDARYFVKQTENNKEIYYADGMINLSINELTDDFVNYNGVFEINRNNNKCSINYDYTYDKNVIIDNKYKNNAVNSEDISENEIEKINAKLDKLREKLNPYNQALECLFEAMFGANSNNDTISQAKLAVFYNDVTVLQEAVTVKALTNYVDITLDPENTNMKDKYDGILSDKTVKGENINDFLGSDVVLYRFLDNADKELGIGKYDLSNYCVDKESGTVYHIKGVVASIDGFETVIYNRNLQSTINIPDTAIKIVDYKK